MSYTITKNNIFNVRDAFISTALISTRVAFKSPVSPAIACRVDKQDSKKRRPRGHVGLNDPRKRRGEKRHGDVARRRDV